MDGKDVLKLVATGLTGCFSGGAFIINVADAPARMTLDTVNCRKHWKEAFNRAKISQVINYSVGCFRCFHSLVLPNASTYPFIHVLIRLKIIYKQMVAM